MEFLNFFSTVGTIPGVKISGGKPKGIPERICSLLLSEKVLVKNPEEFAVNFFFLRSSWQKSGAIFSKVYDKSRIKSSMAIFGEIFEWIPGAIIWTTWQTQWEVFEKNL